MAAKKSTATKPKAAPAAKKTTKAAPKAAKAGSAFMKEMKPSSELAKVVGDKPLPRTEVVKKLWEYIKKHGLQDPNEKRTIVADDNLKAVFGGKKKVSMFEMTKLVNQHLS